MGFIDPNDFESVALDTAFQMSFAFVREHKITIQIDGKPVVVNLSHIPPREWPDGLWKALTDTICAGYVSSLIDQQATVIGSVQKISNLPPLGAGDHPSFSLTNDLAANEAKK